jgi:hypothetical protein
MGEAATVDAFVKSHGEEGRAAPQLRLSRKRAA